MQVNPNFDNGKVIPGEVTTSAGQRNKSSRPRTLRGDVERAVGSVKKHPRLAAAVVAGAMVIGGNAIISEEPSAATVCVDPNTNIKGSEFGGTVSGIAANQLNAAIKKGREQNVISPSDIPNFDAALVSLTDNVTNDIGARNLSSDGTYNMSQQTCVTQNPDTLKITVDSPEAKG